MNKQTAHEKGAMARKKRFSLFLVLGFFCLLWRPVLLLCQPGLQITYGDQGLQALSFEGVLLEDIAQYPGDSFHIWHIKTTDEAGRVLAAGQYGWGENNDGTYWDAASHTKTYNFSWGTISTQFVQSGNNLDVVVTESNRANSGIILCGAEIYPLAFHFPQDPKTFNGYSQFAITTTGPAVSVADYGSGIVTSVIPDESKALYGGWKHVEGAVYVPLMTATAPDGLAGFLPHNDVPVQPGSSFTYTVSLRFTQEGFAADASDAYKSFASTYPSQVTWTDRRLIGTAYLASSPSNADITQPGGFPTNPRRYFNDAATDIYSAAGLTAFQQRMLSQAATNVATARMLNSQGVITWDLEGEQYPQNTSYVCSPDQIAAIAPEMESIVSDTNSQYFGQKLDDAYFKTMSDAGLKVGVCLRPQQFVLHADNTAEQRFLSSQDAIVATLEAKARYANGRWGATLFYVDSTVNPDGGTLDPAIFERLSSDLPYVLFIPEESTPRYYAYSAPFYSFLFHTDLGTPGTIYAAYPNAFGANLVNDVSPATLATHTPQLVQSVARGDILMGHADYWQENNAALVSIYQSAGAAPPPAAKAEPSLVWAQPHAIQYGVPLSSAQLSASANVAGTFTYHPSAGATLHAGTQTLMATFVPADSTTYKTVSASVSLQVVQQRPAITWATPAPLAAGQPLSTTQLNATANVPGSFVYSPAAGTSLPAGSSTLEVLFTPEDSLDYQPVSASVPIAVVNQPLSTPVITWIDPAPLVFGTALSAVQLNAQADVPGTFTYTPSAGAVLPAGMSQLQATFTPAQPDRYSSVTRAVALVVQKAMPSLTWTAPSPMTAGTALSAQQLNAQANIAGTFVYTPGFGMIPPAGTGTLMATFTPADSANFSSQQISVPYSTAAVQPIAAAGDPDVQVVWPAAGATLTGQISVVGLLRLTLDSAGSYLLVDGQPVGTRRIVEGPYRYDLDTTGFTNGVHQLQLWCHDTGNMTRVSAPVTVVIANTSGGVSRAE